MPFIESTFYYFSLLLFSTFMCCCAKWHIHNLECEWTRELLGFALRICPSPSSSGVSESTNRIDWISQFCIERLLQHPNSHLPFFLIVILWWAWCCHDVLLLCGPSVFNDAVWEPKVAMIREGVFFFLVGNHLMLLVDIWLNKPKSKPAH